VIRNWLQPWPAVDHLGRETPSHKRNLPNLSLRTTLYELLAIMPIRPEHLKNSERDGPGLGKIILMLFKHPKETVANKRFLQGLLEEWSRYIFKKTKDYKQLSTMLPRSNKYSARPKLTRQASGESVEDFVTSADRDSITTDSTSARVQVPRLDGYHFQVQPESVQVQPVSGGLKSGKKNQLIKRMKDMQRLATARSFRGEQMSIEGRGLY